MNGEEHNIVHHNDDLESNLKKKGVSATNPRSVAQTAHRHEYKFTVS